MVRGWCSGGKALLLATALGGGMAGCAAQRDDSLRLSEELGRARAEAAWQQTRAAQLELRVSRLEERATDATRARGLEDGKLLIRLDRLLDTNERLLAARTTPTVSESPSAAAPASKAPPVKASPASNIQPEPQAPSKEQQLRALLESLHHQSGRPNGSLTREQENALRILLRNERKLDAENPWSASFY